MAAITLKAHYDGERIRLDEPFDIPANSALLVTVLLSSEEEQEHASWTELSRDGLRGAYGEEEPEYTASLIRERDSTYAGRCDRPWARTVAIVTVEDLQGRPASGRELTHCREHSPGSATR